MDFSKYADMLQMMGAIALGLPALLSGLIAFFMLVPGPQPEAFLQKALEKLQVVVGLIGKFSKKPEQK